MKTLNYFFILLLAVSTAFSAPTRPKDATAAAAPAGDDKLLLDGTTNGTRALPASYYAPATSTTAAIATAQATAISTAATDATTKANAAQAAAIQRSNHTGTQSADTLTDGSTNRLFTSAEKTKVANTSGTNTGDQTPANPTASVGLSAVNGAASSFMRSDAAPPISQAIAPHWTAQHWFDLNPRVSDNAAPATGTSALTLGTNYTLNGLTSNYSFTGLTGTSGRSKVHLIGCNGTATFTWTTAAQRAGDPVGTSTTITPTAGDHTFTFYYDTVPTAYYYSDDVTGPLNLAGGSSVVANLLPVSNGGTGTSTPGIVPGTNVTVTGTWPNQTVNSTAVVAPAFIGLTDAATITSTADPLKAVQNWTETLGGNRTQGTPSGLTNGMTGVLIVKQDATGSRTLTLWAGSHVKGLGATTAITLTATANAIDILTWSYDGTNTYWTSGLGY